MISIFIAAFGIIISLIVAIPNGINVTVHIMLLIFAAFLSNLMFMPKKTAKFKDNDYRLVAQYTLEPLKTDEQGKHSFATKRVATDGKIYISFKCPGKNNKTDTRIFPKSATRLIYDEIPHIKIYHALIRNKGNKLFSVLTNTAEDYIAELHTPDAIAVFSGDSPVKQQ